MTSIRLGEINRLLTRRHGEVLPDTPDIRRTITVIAQHLAALPKDPRRTIPSWLELRAPWYGVGDAKALVLATIDKPKRYKARTIGWLLKLIDIDRKALGITTIAPIDILPADRAKQQAERRRLAQQKRRRDKGAKPRAEYLSGATAQAKPWQTLAMSRRTWYRKGRPTA